MNIKYSCAFTGHRPKRFSFGYDENTAAFIQLQNVLSETIEQFIRTGITKFYTGMALGVDTWAAMAVLEKRKVYPHVQLVAVLPCETQADRWSTAQRERYFDFILPECDDVITLQTGYTPSCMQERNKYLVDHSDYLLAVYDGGDSFSTAYTVQYAKAKTRTIALIKPAMPE